MVDVSVMKGGYARVRMTFTKDNAPWLDVADYSPLAQIRARIGGPVLTTWDITYDEDQANIMILTLPRPKSLLLPPARCVWDIRFLKTELEEPDEDLRAFWYPSSRDADRLPLHVGAPSTEGA